MVKVKVLTRFREKSDRSVVHNIGDIIDVAGDARVRELVGRGIAEPLEPTDVKAEAAEGENEGKVHVAEPRAEEPEETKTEAEAENHEEAKPKRKAPKRKATGK